MVMVMVMVLVLVLVLVLVRAGVAYSGYVRVYFMVCWHY
jgi:hypothetical protein